MAIVTPDVEADVIARAVALAPSLWSVAANTRNIFEGQEQGAGGKYPVKATFVRWYTERRRRTFNGQNRDLLVQFLMRFDRDGFTAVTRAAAKTAARTAYDALHQSGRFTGQAPTSSAYLDITAEDMPNELEPAYFALNFAVTLYG